MSDADPPRLSPRQAACLRLAADGLTSQQIGGALGLSVRTVDQYIAAACRRLEARTRIQAVARAVRLGLVEPEGVEP